MAKKITKNKNMTIDDLAIMVAKGFTSTATKGDLKEISERLDKIDSRLDKLEDKTLVVYTAFEKDLKIKLAK